MSRLRNKRVVALILAAVLACACLPALAFAVGQDADDDRAPAAVAPGADAVVAGQDEADAAAAQPIEAGETDTAAADAAGDGAKAQEGKEDDEPLPEADEALSRRAASDGGGFASLDADSAGTVFTFETPIRNTAIAGDLFWAAGKLELENSQVGNDVLAIGREAIFTDVDLDNDVRLVAQTVEFTDVVTQGNADVGGFEVTIDANSAATGYYCAGGTITYEGKAKRFIAYGQNIYFDGMVDGDVTLSAQEIVIGPHARVTGTLGIRSGQNLSVLSIPETAQIARIDTTMNQPNTIDQITQIRATIAPYFQVGSLLFVVVSFMLLGFAMFWGFGHKLTEANRLIRRYPLAVLVLACIALMLMFVAVTLGALLVFTIPFAAVVLLVLLLSAICCVPFTGASLALMLRRRVRPIFCVLVGSGLGGALLFVPYVNAVVFVGSMIYFVGYIINIGMFGHDQKHDASFHHRETDAEAPKGKASGILPVVSLEEAQEMAPDPSADAINEDWFVEGSPDDELEAEGEQEAVVEGKADADGSGR